MNESDGRVVEYATPRTKVPVSALAVVAFVCSLLSSPALNVLAHTRPFWSGHPLHAVGEMINLIPFWSPLISLLLGLIAVARIHDPSDRRRGMALAIAAIVLSLLWSLFIVVLFIFAPPLPSPT